MPPPLLTELILKQKGQESVMNVFDLDLIGNLQGANILTLQILPDQNDRYRVSLG